MSNTAVADMPVKMTRHISTHLNLLPVTPAFETEYASKLAKIQAIEAEVQHKFLELGRLWKDFRDKALWRAAGDHVHSMREFCEKECKKSHATVYNLIRIAEVFGDLIDDLPPGQPPIEHTRLIKVLPLFKAPSTGNPTSVTKKAESEGTSPPEERRSEDPEEWLHRAVHCDKRGFENFIREAKGKQPTDTCIHPSEEQELWRHCRKCNGWHRIKK